MNSANILKNPLLTPYISGGGVGRMNQTSPIFESSLTPSYSADQTKTPSPERDNPWWENILSSSLPLFRVNLNILWFKIFNYEIMIIERKKTIELWYSLDSRENRLKWNLFEIAKLLLFTCAIRKNWLVEIHFLELQPWENRNMPKKKPEVLMSLRYTAHSAWDFKLGQISRTSSQEKNRRMGKKTF